MDPVFESFQTQANPVVSGDRILPIARNGGSRKILRTFLFSQAQKKRSRIQSRVVAVAGSLGKTSVKEILGHILKVSNPEKVHISPDNQNTKIALATQILCLPPQVETAVFEIGARRPHDFQIPLSFVQPDVVALLNIGTAHVGEFGSLKSLQEEKLSILRAPTARKLVVCADNDLMREFKREVPTLSFGYSPSSDVQILEEAPGHTHLRVENQNHLVGHPQYLVPGSGLNVAAAIALSWALDIKWPQVLSGLKSFSGVSRRFQVFQWKKITAIDDAFNASPESMAQGLRHLARNFSGQRMLLVLGSMLELGNKSRQEHEKIADLLISLFDPRIVTVVTVGEDSRALYNSLLQSSDFASSTFFSSTADEAKLFVESKLSDFDVVYAKASKAIGLQRIFEDL